MSAYIDAHAGAPGPHIAAPVAALQRTGGLGSGASGASRQRQCGSVTNAFAERYDAMRRLLFVPIILLTPAALAARLAPPMPTPIFDPARFFAGATHGSGSLKVVVSKRVQVEVEGHGQVDGNVLTLDQTVREGSEPPSTRRWTFRPLGSGRYAGTLSDAAGPVAGDVTGNRLHLHFRMKGGIVADQLLDLAPDGQSAHNLMSFRKFGIVVARLDETIRRVP
jgi:hypothetical protein